jgi:hypothetical protein
MKFHPFELAALSISEDEPLARSPRHGRLVKLEIHQKPRFGPFLAPPTRWHRFFLDGHQLAIRLGLPNRVPGLIMPHPRAKRWLWPYVSARAPGQNQIGIWSSAGEVAQVGDPGHLIALLRNAVAAADADGFETSLATAPELITWRIPRPPYHKAIEWQHP